MNMQNLNGKRVVITGGSQGLGLATVEVLAACGASMTAISRDRAKLAAAEQAGARVIAGDATDATLMNSVVGEEAPDVLILNAGARLLVKPIDNLSWDEFSIIWNTDVKAGLVGIQAALHIPMMRGMRWMAPTCSSLAYNRNRCGNASCGTHRRARGQVFYLEEAPSVALKLAPRLRNSFFRQPRA
jgi:NAD(P)-dependent dehydrogenase (short-subunit alcohol dehydrogenase family)